MACAAIRELDEPDPVADATVPVVSSRNLLLVNVSKEISFRFILENIGIHIF